MESFKNFEFLDFSIKISFLFPSLNFKCTSNTQSWKFEYLSTNPPFFFRQRSYRGILLFLLKEHFEAVQSVDYYLSISTTHRYTKTDIFPRGTLHTYIHTYIRAHISRATHNSVVEPANHHNKKIQTKVCIYTYCLSNNKKLQACASSSFNYFLFTHFNDSLHTVSTNISISTTKTTKQHSSHPSEETEQKWLNLN